MLHLTLRNRLGRKHGHWWEATVAIQARNGGWNQLVSWQGGGKWLDSGYVLKVGLTELPGRFPVACER